ncbi:hypothetical protein BCON_0235g00200 [Botryotinia convoluta]|uniref:Uncharacterized protein n=1 Tax=Botryotinia convoluta TaxID=54673 RepID=A0A4Z1HJ35_9HELO|nr:hypothetical protein BCON_0235g00200 [Botryotinia convoluta]
MAVTLPQPEIALIPRMMVICEKFFSDNPTFPKNHRYLGQVLTLTLVILNRVKFFDVDKLIMFVGTVFLPYLQAEQNNNPSSPLELWKRSGYKDSSEVEGRSTGNLMVDYHSDTMFHRDFKAHLMDNCKFVVELCTKDQDITMPIRIQFKFQILNFSLS